MKKGLSVLLIAAALFGFYGGATNLNDVLACKDYFTSASGASDDMQRLEDGLNQLKDNEQAYLDGQVALAEGEKALADAEVQLADGEKQLAAGRATYAKGLADYKAAPGQIAKGEKDLAKAIKDRKALKNVKKKIDDVEPAYKPWLKKFNALVESIVDDAENPSKGVLYDAGATAVGLSTINDAFAKVKKQGDDGMAKIEANVKASMISQYKAGAMAQGMSEEQAQAYAESQATDEAVKQAAANSDSPGDENGTPVKALYAKAKGFSDLGTYLQTKYSKKLLAPAKQLNDVVDAVKKADYQATELRESNIVDPAKAGEDALNELMSDPQVKGAVQQFPNDTAELVAGVNQVIGLAQAAQKSKPKYDKDYDELKPDASMGQKIGKKVAAAAKAILGNKDVSNGLTAKQKKDLKPYMNAKAITGLPNIELLYGTMTLGADKKDDGKGSLLDSYKKIRAAIVDGLDKYDAGIDDGKAKLDKGKADYAAAPAKLADGRKQLAEGEAQLADGYAQYEDGKKQLEDGKAQLAQYEDGEQQVRDGLATLVGTDAMGNVQSIADRIGNDTDFDNGDNHLELDEGLSAVQAGKGYAADLTAAVTDEIMGRAVGTGILLGAGVLAVLAALLSFLKKNKGAGVFALLAAAAGCVGAVMGNGAGTQFSSIAGSTVGATPWIAAGILAAVAAVHAIVHFAAKKAA